MAIMVPQKVAWRGLQDRLVAYTYLDGRCIIYFGTPWILVQPFLDRGYIISNNKAVGKHTRIICSVSSYNLRSTAENNRQE